MKKLSALFQALKAVLYPCDTRGCPNQHNEHSVWCDDCWDKLTIWQASVIAQNEWTEDDSTCENCGDSNCFFNSAFTCLLHEQHIKDSE